MLPVERLSVNGMTQETRLVEVAQDMALDFNSAPVTDGEVVRLQSGFSAFESSLGCHAPEGNRQASGPQPRAGQFNSDPVLQVWKMPLRGWQLVLKTRDTFGYVVRLRHLPPFFS